MTRKHKHLVLKWVLGIFAALIAAGIGLFAYMYITTEIPQPEKFALAEKTTVYYNDGTTPIGSYAEQNREIISCADLPDYVGNAIVASEDRSFYTNKGIDPIGIARAFYNNLTPVAGRAVPPSPSSMRNAIIWAKPPRTWANCVRRSWRSKSPKHRTRARCCATT